MIQSIGQATVKIHAQRVQPQNRSAGVLPWAKEAFAIDLDKLFTPSERKTLENIKEYSRSQGMSERDIEMLEGDIITSKYSAQKHSDDISIKEVLSRQIRGVQDGYGNNNGPSLSYLQNVYNNFQMLQGTELFA